MAQARRRVVIYGEVQGVSFRDATARRARERGVTGSVRNRDDGAVEAIFEGPGEAVDALVDWSGRGPSLAHVSRVEVEEQQPEGLSDFEIVG